LACGLSSSLSEEERRKAPLSPLFAAISLHPRSQQPDISGVLVVSGRLTDLHKHAEPFIRTASPSKIQAWPSVARAKGLVKGSSQRNRYVHIK
jgi:hypothetical protein